MASLPTGEWRIEGQLIEASNLVIRLIGPDEIRGVYKSEKGEHPLDDFSTPSLGHREVAAWLVAQAGGWSNIPETAWYDGDLGPGSLQRWVGPLEPVEQNLVCLDEVSEWDGETHPHAIAVFDGADDAEFVLAHADDDELRDIAALDVILNNADRKGSHLISTPDGVFAIDNGLSFHTQDKLRTVLWGFTGEPLTSEIIKKLEILEDQRISLTNKLENHLSGDEIVAFWDRVKALKERTHFPDPPTERYGLPWPPV